MSTEKPSYDFDVPIYEVLQQITIQVRTEAPELQITIKPPANKAWTSVLAEVIEALKPSDKKIMICPKQRKLKDRPESFRKQLESSRNEPFLRGATGGLPIRTPFPAHVDLPKPTPRTPEAQERLRKRAKEFMKEFGHLDPYVITKTATLYDGAIPLISGTLRLRGIDAEEPYAEAVAQIELDRTDMIWDTGSHGCIITRDILPPSFAEYLDRPEHDPYRSETGLVVQAEGYVALTNSGFNFKEVIFKVMPPSELPNSRSGIILGQRGFIDRIVHTATPRAILQRRGEEIGDDEWGVITISEYIDMEDVLHNPE